MTNPKPTLILLLLLKVFSLPSIVLGETKRTLFFHQDELALIEHHRKKKPPLPVETNPKRPSMSAPREVHLSAILLFGDGEFEVWLNGQRYTNRRTDGTLTLLDLSPTKLRVRAEHGDASGRVFEISLNQTVELGSGMRREGPVFGRLADLPFRPLP